MINIDSQIESLQNLSTNLAAKAEELNSSLLITDDDSINTLKEDLVKAVEALNTDIQNMKTAAATANENKKW
jgi:hypothetical protein